MQKNDFAMGIEEVGSCMMEILHNRVKGSNECYLEV